MPALSVILFAIVKITSKRSSIGEIINVYKSEANVKMWSPSQHIRTLIAVFSKFNLIIIQLFFETIKSSLLTGVNDLIDSLDKWRLVRYVSVYVIGIKPGAFFFDSAVLLYCFRMRAQIVPEGYMSFKFSRIF